MANDATDGVVVLTNGAGSAGLYPEVVRAVSAAQGWTFPRAMTIASVVVPADLRALWWPLSTDEKFVRHGSGRRGLAIPRALGWEGDHLILSDAARPTARLVFLPAGQTDFVQEDDPQRWLSICEGDRGCVDRIIFSDGAHGFDAVRERRSGGLC